MTSTSHHHPIVALFFSLNGRKIDDPRTKREIKRRPFILAQKDRRSHRETHPLRSKRMRFVAPFPRERVPLVQRERDDKILQRENYLSPFRLQRAHVCKTTTIKERTRGSLNNNARVRVLLRTLFAKATLLPSAAAVKEEAAIVRRCCVKSEERRERKTLLRFHSSSHLRKDFFFRGPETKERKRRSFFFSS